MELLLQLLKKCIPKRLFRALQPVYHRTLAFAGALRYGFPGRDLRIIGITGTKGKSTTAEILNTILTHAGYTTALSGTIRFKVGEKSIPNTHKMSMPGRFFMQRFLAQARAAGVDYVILEMTSEGAAQSRHRHIPLDALIFTNLQKEHIESHGSMEKYFQAKYLLARSLEHSPKHPRVLIANADDPYGRRFLAATVPETLPFSLAETEPYELGTHATRFTYKNTAMCMPLIGTFNLLNALAAIKYAEHAGITLETIRDALRTLPPVPGRVERFQSAKGFEVVVDYAHTPDSLEALYRAFPEQRKICVLGNTGGGRDAWKRPVMGSLADTHCTEVVLTNEDPYDEDPVAIITAMAAPMRKKPTIILDRRNAITHAIAQAQQGDVVLITGKGTDPYIMGPHGTKEPWSDKKVVEELLAT